MECMACDPAQTPKSKTNVTPRKKTSNSYGKVEFFKRKENWLEVQKKSVMYNVPYYYITVISGL